jgi:nucleotide-binding universal stress UspA family protein
MVYTIRNILYATDLGPRSPEIFGHALAIAQQFQAKIHLLHVTEPMSDFAYSLIDTYVPTETLDSLREEGFAEVRKEIQRRLDKFFEEEVQADIQALVAEVRVVEGMPAEVILEEARHLGADLVVMGSRGHTALGEMLLGSVAHKVTMKSRIPVLLVPLQ